MFFSLAISVSSSFGHMMCSMFSYWTELSYISVIQYFLTISDSQRQSTWLNDVCWIVKFDNSAENCFVGISSSNLEISDESSNVRIGHQTFLKIWDKIYIFFFLIITLIIFFLCKILLSLICDKRSMN